MIQRVRWSNWSTAALIIASGVAPAVAAICRSSRAADTRADLVVLYANVLTVAPGSPHAQAFAVRDGRFVAVGRTDEISRFIDTRTVVWRLNGKTVTPCFNDAHLHPAPAYTEDAPQYIVPCGADHVRTIDEMVAALKHKAAKTPRGQIIRGFGYDDAKLGRHPTCHDLDLASTDHPIVIRHVSGHLSVCNSYMLKAAGITRDTPNPPGGIVGKDGV